MNSIIHIGIFSFQIFYMNLFLSLFTIFTVNILVMFLNRKKISLEFLKKIIRLLIRNRPIIRPPNMAKQKH